MIGAEEDLRHLLGGRYATFERNFTETAKPVLLKDGGLFVDGWRSGSPLAHAAAFIHYPEERTFAAWFDEETGTSPTLATARSIRRSWRGHGASSIDA